MLNMVTVLAEYLRIGKKSKHLRYFWFHLIEKEGEIFNQQNCWLSISYEKEKKCSMRSIIQNNLKIRKKEGNKRN